MPKNKRLRDVVGENVRATMAAKKLSQPKVAALAKKSGTPVDQTTVGRVARADFPATLDTLEAIGNGLGIPAWLLLFESGSDAGLLELLHAWVQSGEQGKRLLALAAKGAIGRDDFGAAEGGERPVGSTGPAQPRRTRSA